MKAAMRLSQPMTQGGQTFLHRWRMWMQIIRLAFLLSIMVSLIGFLGLCAWGIEKNEWRQLYLAHPKAPYCLIKIQHYLIISGLVGLFSGCALFALWNRQGVQAHAKQTTAGLSFAPSKVVIKMIHKKQLASPIHLMDLPLIKGSETQHMLITGTTGSGKTNAFKHLLNQTRCHRAVILDTTGEFVDKYYNPACDIIMNPFDERFPGWHLWGECLQPYHYDEIAESLIPSAGHDPFWTQSSRTLMAEILKLLAKNNTPSFNKILNMVNMMKLTDLYELLKDTKAAALIDPQSEKTATSIRMHLAANIGSLEFLIGMHEQPFSIRQWVQDTSKNGWLFLTMNPAQRSTLRPLMSCWLSIAIKSLMECTPNQQQQLWFMIDELPSLHKLPDLSLCLAEGRKYGACMVLGMQNIPQIEQLYGPHITQSLLDLCSTKVVFRSASFTMAQKLSQLLGMQERREIQEGISYGANEIRDGVSLNVHTTEKSIIPPYDLMNLPDLSSYVQLPNNHPITKVKWDIAV